MAGLFSSWQPRYAEVGIATFPVRDKRPAVSNYLNAGLPASKQFASKFPDEDQFGFACERSRITVLDVDSPDERLLTDALAEYGQTPIIIRSGSGNWQAWYKRNGERRRVRPDPRRPIDILGNGFVVAPPSKGSKGAYQLVCGSLDDLSSLPTMRPPLAVEEPANPVLIEQGRRNEMLWRSCMAQARFCQTMDGLLEYAMQHNQTMFYEPLPDEEVLRVVASAWKKEADGQNWFGAGERVVIAHREIDELMFSDPDAFQLMLILRRKHWGRSFVIANEMHRSMPGGGWSRKRLAAARTRLERLGVIEMIRPASPVHGPSLYVFKGGRH